FGFGEGLAEDVHDEGLYLLTDRGDRGSDAPHQQPAPAHGTGSGEWTDDVPTVVHRTGTHQGDTLTGADEGLHMAGIARVGGHSRRETVRLANGAKLRQQFSLTGTGDDPLRVAQLGQVDLLGVRQGMCPGKADERRVD